jgi:hypothetical protein
VKPHGRDCPHLCSQCLGATPRIVTQAGGELLIDGEPVRPIEPGVNAHYQRRGGLAHGRRAKP